jgi:hypothetical protein
LCFLLIYGSVRPLELEQVLFAFLRAINAACEAPAASERSIPVPGSIFNHSIPHSPHPWLQLDRLSIDHERAVSVVVSYLGILLRGVDPSLKHFKYRKAVFADKPGVDRFAFHIGEAIGDQGRHYTLSWSLGQNSELDQRLAEATEQATTPSKRRTLWPGSRVAPVVPQFDRVQNSSDSLGRLAQPTSEGLLWTETNMDRFIRCQNIKRYRRLLERVTEELDRQTICNLLAEELQKQRDAGDPI